MRQCSAIRIRPLIADGLSRARLSLLDRSTAVSHVKPTTAGCIVAICCPPSLYLFYSKFDKAQVRMLAGTLLLRVTPDTASLKVHRHSGSGNSKNPATD